MKLFEITGTHKTEINLDKAWELIQAHCQDSLNHLDTPIVRGMRAMTTGAGIIQGDAGSRKSANTSNQYTIILDEVLPKEFPKRSASIICANWENRDHAGRYGKLYAIIPFDGVKIGVCPEFDMWDTIVTIVRTKRTIRQWNRELAAAGVIDSMSFDQMIDKIDRYKTNPTLYNGEPIIWPWIKAIKDGPGEVKKAIAKAYTKPFKLTTTKEASYNDGNKHEVWIGGKCVAIELDVYQAMLKAKQ